MLKSQGLNGKSSVGPEGRRSTPVAEDLRPTATVAKV